MNEERTFSLHCGRSLNHTANNTPHTHWQVQTAQNIHFIINTFFGVDQMYLFNRLLSWYIECPN